MLTSSALVTSGVLCAAVGTRLLEAQGADPHERVAVDLVRQAMHWRDVALRGDKQDEALRLQHLAMALALLHASRTLKSDADLERLVGFDVARTARSLETKLTRLRQSVTGGEAPNLASASAGRGRAA
jgi:predicted exporter